MLISGRIVFYCILLVFIYPLFYSVPFIEDSYGHSFELYYFSFVFLIFPVFGWNYISINKLKSFLIFVLFSLMLLSYNGLDNLRPYLWVLILFLSSITFNQSALGHVSVKSMRKLIFSYFLLFLILSMFFIIFDSSYIDNGERYKAFSMSPTHYSIYVLVSLSLYLSLKRPIIEEYSAIALCASLIYLSGTRLSLLIFVIIVVLHMTRFLNYKKPVLLLSILLLVFIYPLYEIIQSNIDLLTFRYDGGEDGSSRTRFMLMEVLFDQSNISNVWNFLFGHGAEFSRLTVAEEFGFDIMPHNDFIRFFLDFGLFSCLILFVILYLVGKDSVLALMLVLIYMSAFYHNMLYSLYFAPLIFIANSSAKLRLKNAD